MAKSLYAAAVSLSLTLPSPLFAKNPPLLSPTYRLAPRPGLLLVRPSPFPPLRVRDGNPLARNYLTFQAGVGGQQGVGGQRGVTGVRIVYPAPRDSRYVPGQQGVGGMRRISDQRGVGGQRGVTGARFVTEGDDSGGRRLRDRGGITRRRRPFDE